MSEVEKWRVIMEGVKHVFDVLLKIVGLVLQIATVVTLPIMLYLNVKNGEKIDTAAVAATTAVAVAKETKQDQGEKLTAIAGGVDASVKSWKAFDSKQPDDMNAAAEAVANAERLIEPVAPPKP